METTRPTQVEVQALKGTLNTTNIQKASLTSICVVNGLPKTGNKPELLARIIRAVDETHNERDLQRFRFIRESVYSRIGKTATLPSPPPQHPTTSTLPQTLSASPTSMPSYGNSRNSSHGYYGAGGHGGSTYNNGYRPHSSTPSYAQQGFQFKKSPFFEVVHRVGALKTCEIMSQHRSTLNFTFKAPDDTWLQASVTDPTLKVMVLCAAANTGVQDISFPHQSELKVNGDDVKANLRGLKNKPGSTRPADITQQLRLNKPAASNTVDFTFALTQHRYYVGVYVCRITSVNDLVKQIQQHGKRISKDSVISELTRKANDPDVVATSQVVSLKCPLSYMRLKTPVRGVSCSHIQCFDALSYLQLQEQGPQWLCPICNKSAPFDQLAADEYMKDILSNTAESIDQISIEPNGRWLQPDAPRESVPKSESQEPTSSFSLDLEDDDEFEILNPPGSRTGDQRTPSLGSGTPRTFGMSTSSYLGTPAFGTPSLATPKTTASPRPSTNSSGKRPATEVIDLTLSDDDEPAQPPAKRPNWGPNGISYGYPRKY